MEILIHINLALSCTMLGIILIIQFVHYPSFHHIEKSSFTSFSRFHARAITPIVATIMLSELLVASLLAWFLYDYFTLINVFLIGLAFVSTFCLSVPIHNKLQNGYDQNLVSKLITTNSPRTILWAIKTGVAFWITITF